MVAIKIINGRSANRGDRFCAHYAAAEVHLLSSYVVLVYIHFCSLQRSINLSNFECKQYDQIRLPTGRQHVSAKGAHSSRFTPDCCDIHVTDTVASPLFKSIHVSINFTFCPSIHIPPHYIAVILACYLLGTIAAVPYAVELVQTRRIAK